MCCAILCLLLALTRSEIIARMRAPVVTQADGLVQIYANCPEDMRREYQSPVGRFAADTIDMLYRDAERGPKRFPKAGIVIHLGEGRTNDAAVVARVATNAQGRVVTRIFLPSPGYSDLEKLRLELTRGFYRSVKDRELTLAEAVTILHHADPAARLLDTRRALEEWYAHGVGEDEKMIALTRKVIEPGVASRRDVQLFAARLFLYPPYADLRFANGKRDLDFHEAIVCARTDATVRLMASLKWNEPLIFGCGRGEALTNAAREYSEFLRALANPATHEAELASRLAAADQRLNTAWQKAVPIP